MGRRLKAAACFTCAFSAALGMFYVGCGAQPEPAAPPEPVAPPEPAPEPPADPPPAAEPAVLGAVTVDPTRCPAGSVATLLQERRCAPCPRGRVDCPCSGPLYRCDPPPAPVVAQAGPSCGTGPACAAGEECCVGDCAGTLRCAPRAACPELACTTCPSGTCRRRAGGPCETPTGQLGNACCSCGADGMCADFCRCAALDTPIATPDGSRAIAELEVGDLVLSVDHGRRVAVPIVRVHRALVVRHRVVRVELATGRTLRMSPGHPTADGRTFGELHAGERVDGVEILTAQLEPYEQAETADILPASDTGTYIAAGVLVRSTLAPGPSSRPSGSQSSTLQMPETD